jgi:hypothetical protein
MKKIGKIQQELQNQATETAYYLVTIVYDWFCGFRQRRYSEGMKISPSARECLSCTRGVADKARQPDCAPTIQLSSSQAIINQSLSTKPRTGQVADNRPVKRTNTRNRQNDLDNYNQ